MAASIEQPPPARTFPRRKKSKTAGRKGKPSRSICDGTVDGSHSLTNYPRADLFGRRGTSAWSDDLSAWLKPLLARLGHKARRRMCPLFVAELIEPGERKSVGPTVERLAPGAYDQLHHFAPERSVGRLRSTSRAKARPRAKSAR